MFKHFFLRPVWLSRSAVVVLLTLVGGFLAISCGLVHPSLTRATETNNNLNFQARLLNSSGAIVPDGYYNIEFKLYDASSGGSNLWTETRLYSASTAPGNAVRVVNGYMTVNLGSVTAFPAINWDQDLYITMNIGKIHTASGGTTCTDMTAGQCAGDGEMTNGGVRMRLTGVPYAFRAGQLAQYNSGTGFTSSLKLVQPTVGNQVFRIPDQAAAGTYDLCVVGSTSCGFASSSSAFLQGGNSFGANAVLGTKDNFPLTFITNNTEKMRVTSGGTLMIGSTGTAGTVEKLRVNTPTTVDNAAAVIFATGATTSKGLVIQGVASQTANLFEVQAEDGSVLWKVTRNATQTHLANGGNTIDLDSANIRGWIGPTAAYLGTGSSATTLSIATVGATRNGIVVHGSTSQTADLQVWENNSSAALLRVSAAGVLGSADTSATSTNSSAVSIRSGNATGATSNSGAVTLDVGTATGTAGVLNLGNSNASAIAIGHSGIVSTFTGAVALTNLGTTDTNSLLCRNSSNQIAGCSTTGTGTAFVQGGNSFGATAILGTADNNALTFITNNTEKMRLTTGGAFQINSTGTAGTVEKLRVNTPTTTDNSANVIVSTSATTSKGLVIQGTASQAANLQEWQDSTGAVLSSISSAGAANFASFVAIGTTPAQSEGLRLENTKWVASRNSTNSGDVNLIRNSGTTVELAGSGATGILITDAKNIALGTSTGTKIGTATTQKLGFFNATPIIQPGSTTDLRQVMINLGLLASGGATPLDLNGGALTAGSASITGLTTIGTLGTTDTNTPLCRNSSNQIAGCSTTGTGTAFVQGGNSFGATAILGTNDNNALTFITNTAEKARLTTAGVFQINSTGTAGTVEKFRVNTPTTVDNNAVAIMSAATATDRVLVLQGAASQTGNLLVAEDSTGSPVALINSAGSFQSRSGTTGAPGFSFVSENTLGLYRPTSGVLGVTVNAEVARFDSAGLMVASTGTRGTVEKFRVNTPTTGDNAANAIMSASAAASKALVVQAAASQSANIFEVQNSSGTALVSVNSGGGLIVSSGGGVNTTITPRQITIVSDNAATPVFTVNSTGGANSLRLQNNGVDVITATQAGSLTVAGTYNTNTFTSSALTFGAAGTSTIQSAASQSLNITSNGNSLISTSAGTMTLQGASTTTVKSADQSAASTNSAAVAITTGNANGATSNSGNLAVDVGTATGTAGILSLGASNASAINVGHSGVVTTFTGNVALGNLGTANTSTLLCRNASNQIATCSSTGTGTAFVQGGNAFGATAVLGTTDANGLQIVTGSSSTGRLFFAGGSNDVYFGNAGSSGTDAAPNNFTLNGTGSSTAGTTGGDLTVIAGAGATTGAGSAGGALRIQGGSGGGTDIQGGNVLVAGGQGTGTAAGGNILFQVAKPGSTGNSNNSLSTVGTFSGSDGSLTLANDLVVQNNGNVGLGALASGNARLYVEKTYTGATTGEQYGQHVSTTFAVADTGLKQGLRVDTVSSLASGTLANLLGITAINTADGNGATTTNAYANYVRNDTTTGHTLQNAYGYYVANGSSAGTITNQYGITVAPLTSGTNNYGLVVGTASTQTLWLSNDADNTTASAGIAFGSSLDTNLYRSGASILRTDGILAVGTLGTASNNTLLCRNGSGQIATCSGSLGGTAYIQGGNSFGTTAVLGTGDANPLTFITSGSERMRLTTAGVLQVNSTGTAGTVEKFRVNTPTTVDNNAATILAAGSAAERVLVLQAAASQSANLLVAEDSTGTAVALITAGGSFQGRSGTTGAPGFSFVSENTLGLYRPTSGVLGVTVNAEVARFDSAGLMVASTGTRGTVEKFRVIAPTTADNSANTILSASAATSKALVVQAAASQSANIFEVQNSSGTALVDVTSGGSLVVTAGGGVSTTITPGTTTIVSGNASTPVLTVNSTGGAKSLRLENNGSDVLTVAQNGDTVIGGSTASYRLDVIGNQSSDYIARIQNTNTANTADGLLIDLGVANASRGSGNYFVGFAGAGTVAGKIQGAASSQVAYTTSAADYAEYFKAEPHNMPTPGELVRLDPSQPQSVLKSNANSQVPLVGVVSTSPGFIGNGPICKIEDQDCDKNYAKYNAIVALSGQVPLRVNNSHGPIAIGDAIGVSAVTGQGAKANGPGYIVGYALQPLTKQSGTVIILVRPQYKAAGVSDLQLQSLNVKGDSTIGGNINISGQATATNLVVKNSITTTNLQVSDWAQVGSLNVTRAITTTDLKVTGVITVETLKIDGSATVAGNLVFSAPINSKSSAIIRNFKASQPITIGSVVVLDSTQDGYVALTSKPQDTHVVGVATSATTEAGQAIQVAVSGQVQVKINNDVVITAGDLLVSGPQAGLAGRVEEPKSGALLGKATSRSDGQTDLVWVLLTLQ